MVFYRVRVVFSRVFHRFAAGSVPGGSWGDERFEDVGGVGLHAGQHVLVGLDGEGDVGVTEPFADHLDRDPALMSRVPWVWRRSCRRMTGTPARRAMRSKAWEMAWGGWVGRRRR